MSTVIGPVQLYDKKDGSSERTSPQIFSNPLFDSRVYPNYRNIPYCIIREIRKDPTIQLARWAVLSPMIHTPWMYEKKKNGTQEMIDFLEENFSPLRNEFLLRAVFGTLDFGWQPFEVVLKPELGYIYIDEIKHLLHDITTILVYINNGKFAGFINQTFAYNVNVLIPEAYALNTNFETEGTDWYGYSVFQSLYKICESWDTVQTAANRYDKKIAGATWVIYFPVGKTLYKGVQTPNDEIANSLLDTLVASGGIAISDDIQTWMDDAVDRKTKGAWRIEILSADAQAQNTFIDRQKYLDSLKIRAFGLTERSLLEGSHGTKAEADVHGDVSLSVVDSRHRLLVERLNTTVVPRLLALNFGKKYAYAAGIRPAPLVDTQFATIKSIYERIIMDGDALAAEIESLDMKGMRDELGIPSSAGPKIIKEKVMANG